MATTTVHIITTQDEGDAIVVGAFFSRENAETHIHNITADFDEDLRDEIMAEYAIVEVEVQD